MRSYLSRALTVMATAMMVLSLMAPAQAAPPPTGVEVPYAAQNNPSGKLDSNGNALHTPRLSGAAAKLQVAEEPWQAECPPTIRCEVVPAAYRANDGNVADYGNYDKLPFARPIDGFLVHTTEGDTQRVLELFQDSRSYVGAHYVLDGKACKTYQMVRLNDLPWHAGNWDKNTTTVGLEFVGHMAAAQTEITPCAYKMAAEITKYVIQLRNIPCAQLQCVMSHNNVPATKASGIAGMHNDPGPYFNYQLFWEFYYGVKLPLAQTTFSLASKNYAGVGVTIAPVWPLHKEEVTGCSHGSNPPSCAPSGLNPVNFVYLRTQPNSKTLITDPVLGAGSTDINNNAARVFYGQTYAVMAHQLDPQWRGVWLKIAVNGVEGWFYNPWSAPTAFPNFGGGYATTKGNTPVATYGRPIPDRSEYPANLIAVEPGSWYIPTPSTFPYTIKPGQKVKVLGPPVQARHFYAWAIDSSFPYDHTLFKGKKMYLEVQLGSRRAWVLASDITP